MDGKRDLILELDATGPLSRRERRALAREVRRQLEQGVREQLGGRSPRPYRRSLATAAAMAVALAAAPAAQAAVTATVSGGQLTVTSTASDSITITCVGAAVKVNGANPGPNTAVPTNCSLISSISVSGGTGANAGFNNINLSAVSDATGYTDPGLDSGTPVTLNGGDASDTVRGSSFNDSLLGGAGGDSMRGGPSADSIDGGSEEDVVGETADVNFTLTPTSLTGLGNDTLSSIESGDLIGGASANTIDASTFTGFVALSGLAGNDIVTGPASSSGSPGNFNRLFGGNDPDTVTGGSADDSIEGGSGADNLTGAAGNDTMSGGLANDTVDAGPGTQDALVEGDDVNLTLTPTSLTAVGGLGTDSLGGFEQATLFGGSSANTIDAQTFGGPVSIFGTGGADVLIGGDSPDVLNSGDGTSGVSIVGNGGDDVITADINGEGTGNDTLRGGPGADTLDSDFGTDSLFGDGGSDVLRPNIPIGDLVLTDTSLQSTDANYTLASIEQADQLFGTPTSLQGGGGSHDDLMDASQFSGPVKIDAGDGGDTVLGGAGSDSLDGSVGGDSINGGLGDDTYLGGSDGDVINSQDGIAEANVRCGAENDVAFADAADGFPLSDCEQVVTPPGPVAPPQTVTQTQTQTVVVQTPPPSDQTAPNGRVTPGALTGGGVFSGSYACPVGEQACLGDATLESASAVSAVVRRRPRKVRLGTTIFHGRGGRALPFRIQLTRANLALIRRLGRLRVKLILRTSDAAGNSATTTTTFTLRAPARRRR